MTDHSTHQTDLPDWQAQREPEAARLYAEMEAARAQFYGDDNPVDPHEGSGALAWGLLSLTVVLASLAVWALIRTAHGGF